MRIDKITRQIDFVPGAVVEDDNGVSSFTFEIPADMTDWEWTVAYINADGEVYETPLTVQENAITWTLDETVTAAAGRVAYTLKAETEGMTWHSLMYSFPVYKTIKGDQSNGNL